MHGLVSTVPDRVKPVRHERLPVSIRNRLSMTICALVLLTVLGGGCTLIAQSAEDLRTMKTDIQALKEGQEVIQKDLARIKEILLEKRPTSPSSEISLNLDNDPFIGEKNAKVTVIEFTDFQCMFCGRHAAQTLPKIIADYVKTGKVKYVIRDFPLGSHLGAW